MLNNWNVSSDQVQVHGAETSIPERQRSLPPGTPVPAGGFRTFPRLNVGSGAQAGNAALSDFTTREASRPSHVEGRGDRCPAAGAVGQREGAAVLFTQDAADVETQAEVVRLPFLMAAVIGAGGGEKLSLRESRAIV